MNDNNEYANHDLCGICEDKGLRQSVRQRLLCPGCGSEDIDEPTRPLSLVLMDCLEPFAWPVGGEGMATSLLKHKMMG